MKNLIIILSFVFIVFIISFTLLSPTKNPKKKKEVALSKKISAAEKVVLRIVYDNNPHAKRLKTDWGFGCYINVDTTKILFDTGEDPTILLSNMAKLNINPKGIDIVVLSHIHGDHIGGLFGFLEQNPKVKVYLPASFPNDFKRKVRDYGCEVIGVKSPMKICESVLTTGELGALIKEQSLIIASKKGIIVITGCAHPGVANIVKKAKELTEKKVYLVLGGFPLIGKSKNKILSIIKQFKKLGVIKTAPCHCSGNLARALFKKKFGENYREVGVGSKLEVK